MQRQLTILCVLVWTCLFGASPAFGQRELYESRFDLADVTLLDGPFKRAQDRNYELLLEYDVKRLLTPFIRQAGLSTTANEHNKYFEWEYEHPNFESWAWNPSLAMDGHVGGHYLSALALAYASCHDPGTKARLKERIDYMLDVLKDCQDVFAKTDGMKGFIGGIPNNDIWKSMADGDYRVYNQHGNWVPLYCEHKIMAGLRDAYLYTGSAKAKDMFRDLCDWGIRLVELFTEDIMEMQILQWEHGSISETYADASVLFGAQRAKYMKAAKKYSHQIMIENMLNDTQHNFLDLKHTNESTAKFVGFARIGLLTHESRYLQAAINYWDDVVSRRTTAIGGSGVASYFQPAAKASRYITEADGPESCNTYNMLKLTELLYQVTHDAKYIDYYEKATLNHILSTQDPQTGGYVFYTPTRPGAYRIYSKPNEAMWCCVGTGMENHSKYGEYIYSMDEDTVFVNLFIASELNCKDVALRQESNFPYGQKSTIRILKDGHYKLCVRHPAWAAQGYDIKVNGKAPRGFDAGSVKARRAYNIFIGKDWKAGDVIEVTYPMMLSFEPCPNVGQYIALQFGPSVLAAVETSSKPGAPNYENLMNEYGGEKRHDNEPSTKVKFKSLAFAPMLICELQSVPQRIKMTDPSSLTFNVDASAMGSLWDQIEVRPFYDVHHSRYTIYWNQQTPTAWQRNPLYKEELRLSELEKATYDRVKAGDESSEAAHGIQTSANEARGYLNNQPFREAMPNEWFEYALACDRADASTPSAMDSITLLCRFSVRDRGRTMLVTIDGQPVGEVGIPSSMRTEGKNQYFDMPVNFPVSMVRGKKSVRVRFASNHGSFVPKLFDLRMMRNDPSMWN